MFQKLDRLEDIEMFYKRRKKSDCNSKTHFFFFVEAAAKKQNFIQIQKATVKYHILTDDVIISLGKRTRVCEQGVRKLWL